MSASAPLKRGWQRGLDSLVNPFRDDGKRLVSLVLGGAIHYAELSAIAVTGKAPADNTTDGELETLAWLGLWSQVHERLDWHLAAS